MLDRLNDVEKRFESIENDLLNPDIMADIEKYTSLLKERAGIEDIVMKFRDNGTPYNPLEDMLNDDDIADYDPENEEGGLGKYIAFNIADDVKYNYTNNENTLEITKRRKES